MRDEELDGQVYHLLAGSPGTDEPAIAALLHATSEEIGRSLERLESALLVEKGPSGLRVLSIPEMILRCQARYDPECPFTMDNGVIRVKTTGEKKDD